ncbi:MAG: mechanosensitive ion channel, partial [Proteobacteria bacterium]|nr:mechanosensitive ion channel [Pseudomonadota bacterium]
MKSLIELWNSYPKIQQLVWVAAAALLVMVLVRAANHFFSARVKDPIARYRMRKFISFVGYAAVIVYAAVILSSRMGEFAVAFGLIGAGVALALQEAIISVAGWASVSTGFVFRTGDRVKIGNVLGDVIDTGFLRTTLMELGEWVNGDQYNGRMVRVPNSLIFKGPV